MINRSTAILIISLLVSCSSCKKRTWVCYCDSIKPPLHISFTAQGYTKRGAEKACKALETNTFAVGFTPDICYIVY